MLLRSDSSLPYPASYYDDDMCLRVPPLLWMASLYLSRSIILPMVMGLGHVAGVDDRAIAQFHGLWSASGLLPSLLAALVLLTLVRRVPTAGGWVRWMWARGRTLLAVAAILDIVLLAAAYILQAGSAAALLFSMVSAALDIFFLVYILAGRRVRHAFAEFPAPLH